MKEYYITLMDKEGEVVDTKIEKALSPTNALIKYLNKKEIDTDNTIKIEEVK